MIKKYLVPLQLPPCLGTAKEDTMVQDIYSSTEV